MLSMQGGLFNPATGNSIRPLVTSTVDHDNCYNMLQVKYIVLRLLPYMGNVRMQKVDTRYIGFKQFSWKNMGYCRLYISLFVTYFTGSISSILMNLAYDWNLEMYFQELLFSECKLLKKTNDRCGSACFRTL